MTKAEKREKAIERRKRVRELARKVSGMTEAQRADMASKMNVTTIEGRALSPFNSVLLSMQRADITLVGGFRQWRKAGRCVRKGEKGLALWIPRLPRKAEAESEADDSIRFIIGTVFDISQTVEAEAS